MEDEAELLALYGDYFSAHGFQVISASTREQAEAALAKGPFAAIVTDLRLNGEPWAVGLKFARMARFLFPSLPIILLTAAGDIDLLGEARKAEVTRLLFKPQPLQALEAVVRDCIANGGGVQHASHQ